MTQKLDSYDPKISLIWPILLYNLSVKLNKFYFFGSYIEHLGVFYDKFTKKFIKFLLKLLYKTSFVKFYAFSRWNSSFNYPPKDKGLNK